MNSRISFGMSAFLATACVLLEDDFAKGTLVASLAPASGSVQKWIQLPAGEAELVLAIRGYMCRPPNPSTVVKIRLLGDDQDVILDNALRLKDLTWSYAQKSCDAYGYVYDESVGQPKLRFTVPRDTRGRFQVTASIGASREPDESSIDLWIIYNGRAPVPRMFVRE